METNLEPPNPPITTTTTTITTTTTTTPHFLSHHSNNDDNFYDDDESTCSTPYVSAPSSPGRSLFNIGFFYSAPTSPMHYVLSSAPPARSTSIAPARSISDASSSGGSFEFEFSARFDSSPAAPEIAGGAAMCSADELFLNGQIRPMKLSAHLQRPQTLAPLIDFGESENDVIDDDDDDENEDGTAIDDVFERSRVLRLRKNSRSQRRRARSMSPLRSTTPFDWLISDDVVLTPKKDEERENGGNGRDEETKEEKEERENETNTTPSGSASSSRCSSAGRSSKRWIFLKDLLRSKSEGRSNNKFWHNISFSPATKEKLKEREKERGEKSSINGGNVTSSFTSSSSSEKMRMRKSGGVKERENNPATAKAKRRSAHEMHYTANRAQAEEMRKKTFLPYRQGLLGCLGFNSKSYGALNGFARALNPVSSR